jgi:sugar-phosphatase
MPFEIQCDAVLFDLDGVLVNSAECIANHWRQWALDHQLDPIQVLRLAQGRRTLETVRLAAPVLDAEQEAAAIEAAEAVDTQGLVKIDGAARLIQSIPDGAWAVVTSGSRNTALNRLAFGGIPIAPVLIAAEDVKFGKPDPQPYLLAAQKLGVAPAKCLVVEDSPAGVRSARNAGMGVVAVASTHAPAELAAADVVARQLNSITIVSSPQAGLVRCIVRVIESQDAPTCASQRVL